MGCTSQKNMSKYHKFSKDLNVLEIVWKHHFVKKKNIYLFIYAFICLFVYTVEISGHQNVKHFSKCLVLCSLEEEVANDYRIFISL